MTGTQLSAAVYGLRGLPSCSKEVRQLLQLLTEKLTGEDTPLFSERDFKNLVYGLQSMSCEQEEVRGLIRAVLSAQQQQSPWLEQGQEQSLRFGEYVATSVYGLREMSSEHEEVRALLAHILAQRKPGNGSSSFTEQEISNTLYGLQSMSDEHEEVCACACVVYENHGCGVCAGQSHG